MKQWIRTTSSTAGWLQLAQADAGSGTVTAELPTRDEIDDQYKWRVEDIYASETEWDQDAQQVRALTREFVQFQGQLGESAAKLLAALRLMDESSELLGKVYAFAFLRQDENTADSARQALYQRAMALVTEVSSQFAFLEPEILSLPEGTVESFIQTEPGLQHYAFYLTEMLRQKPHVLSIEEEQLLAQASEIFQAPKLVFEMLNEADLRFPKVKDDEGREIELTHGRYGVLRESRNRDVRRGAFEAMYSAYESHKNMLAANYATAVKRGAVMAKIRGFESARAMSMFGDNVPVSVYDSLIDAVHESLPALKRYMELRKRVLGLDELHTYDLDVPLVGDVDVEVPYSEAVETVLASIQPLGDDYVLVAKQGLQSGWVDVYESRGKASGGYNMGVYGVHPYILLNYQSRFEDARVLAHELGHAMHGHYTAKHQPHIYGDYSIFVAEVASTFNENLLYHHLKSTTTDPTTKAAIINQQVDTIRGTLIVQTLFAEIEKLAHERVEAGEPLTVDWLCEMNLQLNELYYGSVCTIDPQLGLLWSRIPHFHRPFYVYKYATGISAATALSERILNGGEKEAEDYRSFLSGGSSDYPINLLRRAGVDMESPEPVKATLRLFSDLVGELASLIG